MPRRRGRSAKLGSVYSRRGGWYIRFTFNGREYRESSKSTERDVALKMLERQRNEVVEGKMVGPRRQALRFDDLVSLTEADYRANGRKSTESTRYRLKHLRKAFGTTPAAEITNRTLKPYVNHRVDERASAATIRYELVLIGRMFTLAVEADLLRDRPPLPTVVVRNARQGFFEAEEVAAVLKHLPPDVAPAIEFAYITGWRIGEIRRPSADHHLDLDAQVVRLGSHETKGGEGRAFPFRMHERLQALIRGASGPRSRSSGAIPGHRTAHQTAHGRSAPR